MSIRHPKTLEELKAKMEAGMIYGWEDLPKFGGGDWNAISMIIDAVAPNAILVKL
jgi:hypothetical protein